ncbi:hypothetical protein ACLOJK_015879 [Asimina triloba]
MSTGSAPSLTTTMSRRNIEAPSFEFGTFEEQPFTEEQEALVMQSWWAMRLDVPKLGKRFFTLVMELAPEAKSLFSFLGDADADGPKNSVLLRAHCVMVFRMTCDAAVQLHQTGNVTLAPGLLKHIGATHVAKGVSPPFFWVLREAMLRSVEEMMGEKWSEEMEDAWGIAFDRLTDVIKEEMRVAKMSKLKSSSLTS